MQRKQGGFFLVEAMMVCVCVAITAYGMSSVLHRLHVYQREIVWRMQAISHGAHCAELGEAIHRHEVTTTEVVRLYPKLVFTSGLPELQLHDHACRYKEITVKHAHNDACPAFQFVSGVMLKKE